MNDLNEAYSYYSSADHLLKMIDDNKRKSIKRSSLKNTPFWRTVIELILAHNFITTSRNGKKEELILTDMGIKHVREGGFLKTIYPEKKKEKKKSFKEVLEELTGLLTIFGILNAVTIFARQFKISESTNPFGFGTTGIQFVSISMYILSLVVLVEIIWTTIKEGDDSFKFSILYFLLCMTTSGIGLLFLTQYKEFIYGVSILVVFFILIVISFSFLLKLFAHFITKRTVIWFKDNSSKLIIILLIISIILSGIILMYTLPLLLKVLPVTIYKSISNAI